MAASAVILFGPPGSGKSTQAELLADTLAYEVVDTGRLLHTVLYDPERQADPVIAAERKRFDSGELVTTSFVVGLLKNHLISLGAAGTSCVLGGSPRTMEEAEVLLPQLIASYGLDNVHCLLLDMSREACSQRSQLRTTCKVCGRPQLALGPAGAAPERCRVCGGELYVRSDINAIDVRFHEYETREVPVFAYAQSLGISFAVINADADPAAVYDAVVAALRTSHV